MTHKRKSCGVIGGGRGFQAHGKFTINTIRKYQDGKTPRKKEKCTIDDYGYIKTTWNWIGKVLRDAITVNCKLWNLKTTGSKVR